MKIKVGFESKTNSRLIIVRIEPEINRRLVIVRLYQRQTGD